MINDTGVGIPPDNLEAVFETFWRSDHSHFTPGLGLGLPIARKIIELHNGEIAIKSSQELGTTVYVTLPLAPNSFHACV